MNVSQVFRALRRFLNPTTSMQTSTIAYPWIADCGYPPLQARFQCERFGHRWGRWTYHRVFAYRERECKRVYEGQRCDAVESQALPVGEERV